MCGRYTINKPVQDIFFQLTEGRSRRLSWRRFGDVYPSQTAPILTGIDPDEFENSPGLKEAVNPGVFDAEEMHWGFVLPHRNQLLINARAETAAEKKSFAESVRSFRCIIIASAFYEWNKAREKVTFYLPDKSPIYMAGLYQPLEDGKHFTILTTAANESMIPVHDRMPLILPEDRIHDWIFEPKAAKEMLQLKPAQLIREQDFEQQRLPF